MLERDRGKEGGEDFDHIQGHIYFMDWKVNRRQRRKEVDLMKGQAARFQQSQRSHPKGRKWSLKG